MVALRNCCPYTHGHDGCGLQAEELIRAGRVLRVVPWWGQREHSRPQVLAESRRCDGPGPVAERVADRAQLNRAKAARRPPELLVVRDLCRLFGGDQHQPELGAVAQATEERGVGVGLVEDRRKERAQRLVRLAIPTRFQLRRGVHRRGAPGGGAPDGLGLLAARRDGLGKHAAEAD